MRTYFLSTAWRTHIVAVRDQSSWLISLRSLLTGQEHPEATKPQLLVYIGNEIIDSRVGAGIHVHGDYVSVHIEVVDLLQCLQVYNWRSGERVLVNDLCPCYLHSGSRCKCHCQKIISDSAFAGAFLTDQYLLLAHRSQSQKKLFSLTIIDMGTVKPSVGYDYVKIQDITPEIGRAHV